MLTNYAPGVKTREIPSGARAISSIATSNTAFVDVFKRGPLNQAVRITSWADFESVFGGLWTHSEASYALNQYFLNGGNVAFVVRVGDSLDGGNGDVAASGLFANGASGDGSGGTSGVRITAASSGAWGNTLHVAMLPTGANNQFDLLVRRYDGPRVVSEELYQGLRATGTAAEELLEARSDLIRIAISVPNGSPAASRPPVSTVPSVDPSVVNTAELRRQALLGLTRSDMTTLTGGEPDPQFTAAELQVQGTTDQGAVNAVSLTALSAGSWGNEVYIATAPHAADANRYDLLIRLYSGATLLAEELYQGVSNSTDPDAAQMVETVVNGISKLVTVSALAAATPDVHAQGRAAFTSDTLPDAVRDDMVSLVGGDDGAVPGRAGWQAKIRAAIVGSGAARTGLHALENIIPEVFNLMALPVASLMDAAEAVQIYEAAEKYCRDRYAFLLLDPAAGEDHSTVMVNWFDALGGANSKNTAGYFPRLSFPDPLKPGSQRDIGPSGMVAGMMARIDATRGVWKAPAGTETRFSGGAPAQLLTDLEQDPLNRNGLNVLRSFPVYGDIIWGARTRVGADALADENKYVPVRRTALFIQQSLQRGLKWTVFEGNDEVLWGKIRMNVKAFMQGLHRQGAFQGTVADEAYLVKCDAETTTQADIDLGIVNILVAFAPLKPAEFVVLNFKQLTKLAE